MKAAIFGGPRNLTVGERQDPAIEEPSDAIVRVTTGAGAVGRW